MANILGQGESIQNRSGWRSKPFLQPDDVPISFGGGLHIGGMYTFTGIDSLVDTKG